MEQIGIDALFFAGIGGLVPALIWLLFFLRQDKKHPEPKLLILLAFVAGMLSVFAALGLEQIAHGYLVGPALIIVWAAIEEVVKWAAAAATVLWRPYDDEPIDPIIYMITVALGFSALETGLFLLAPLVEGDMLSTILTSNLRFLGASLLHIVASAVVGIALAFSFYRPMYVKIYYLLIGLFLAVVLHALFNFFIIDASGVVIMLVFFFVWLAIVVLFLFFEKVKRISKPLFIKK